MFILGKFYRLSMVSAFTSFFFKVRMRFVVLINNRLSTPMSALYPDYGIDATRIRTPGR